MIPFNRKCGGRGGLSRHFAIGKSRLLLREKSGGSYTTSTQPDKQRRNAMSMKIFYSGMIQNRLYDDTPVGDLARDMNADKRWYLRSTGYSRNLTLLTLLQAAPTCIDAFNAAWLEYEAYKKERRYA
jgi:hypothetical protein